MKPTRPVVQSGSFVNSPTGERFRLVSQPTREFTRGTVVFVHAFAEEMNKSRRMVARMARLLAEDGWRVVQRDLRGCGDSAGDFGDASWEDWVHDVRDELLRANDGPVWLWGQRAGALLASAALVSHPNANLLLWQPVTSGALHLQQFLRLHAGARIVGSPKGHAGPSPMQCLREGASVEVGGYMIQPGLARGLQQASFDLPEGYAGHVIWFEISIDALPQTSASTTRELSRLRERGITVKHEVLQGPPFWTTQEIQDCDVLLERTRAAVQASGSSAGSRPTAKAALVPHKDTAA